MTDLNEKLKLVAEYDGYEVTENVCYRESIPIIPVRELKYHSSYDRQITVWQKVCKEFLDMEKCTDDLKQFMLFKEKYCKHICYNTPLESFEILVQAIQFINKMEK